MKITLHPLFIALGILVAIFGGLPIYLIYALTALLHECGHIFCAAKIGFRCEKISLMPYGASAICDTEGIRPKDEVKLALAGPAVNAFLCVLCAGLWWFYPVTYAYTDTVFSANAVMLIINLLPAYPLDGGRAAAALLSTFMKKRRAKFILRIFSGCISVALIFVFIFALRNISLLIFALFLTASALGKDGVLSRINFSAKKIKRGREMRHIILTESSTFKDALRYVDDGKYCVFQYFSNGILDEVTEEELFEMLETKSIYDKVFESPNTVL
ncbi:MAG: hypothetical protein K2N23_08450 [Clostridia bacterium]|nr:hypothetical protein [Clostridia bacterium]